MIHNLRKVRNWIIYKFEMNVMKIYKDPHFIHLLKQEKSFWWGRPSELFMIHELAKKQKGVEGDYAEVGVYNGLTAKFICEAKGDKPLHLFDTFEGLPEISKYDKTFHKGQYNGNELFVKKRLKNYPNIFIYKGLFPRTSEPIKNKKFVFVHLDADIYQSIKDCLEFFYPRMNKGGIILSHDYTHIGVKKAFNDFFNDKPETIIELPMSQCIVIKNK